MQSIFKKMLILIFVILFFTAFSASYSSLNIDNLAFVVALGIDVSDADKIKVTFQFVNPPSSTEGTNQESKIFENSVESDSIPNAINLMNTYLARKLDLSHCRIIVFSEALAKNDISEYVYSLMNDIEIRPSSNIIVSKCDSEYYISNSKPSLETSITRYYDIFPNSSRYTGYLTNATIGGFFNSLACTYCQPHAILGGVSSSNSNTAETKSTIDSEVKSNLSPIISANRGSENIGTAVFNHGKLVGELNAIETVCFNIIENDVDSFLISIPNPKNDGSNLDLYLVPKSDTKIKVDIINNSPYIKIDTSFSAKIYSISSNSNYLDNDVLSSIALSCDKYLESVIRDYLYKTSSDFKSDLNGLGKYALSNFWTNSDFEKFSWATNYPNSSFEVNVDTNIDSGSLLSQVQS